MVSFRVRASSLSEVGTLLGTVVATFDAHLAVVDSRVKASVGATWDGEDADNFAEGWATFMATSAHVRQSLVALQGGLFAADGSYTQAESGIQRTFAGRTNSVAAVRSTASGVNGRVDTGEQRADAIAEHFGRGDESGSAQGGAFIAGASSRPSSGQQSSGPAEEEATAEAVFEADASVDGEALSGEVVDG